MTPSIPGEAPTLLIDDIMPAYDVSEYHSIKISSPVGTVYQAVKELDLCDSTLVRALFFLRELPAYFAARAGSGNRLCLDLRGMLENGFVLLGERTDREIALGLVGRFWTVGGDIQRIEADRFRSFDDPRFAKAVWNFSLQQSPDGRTVLATETRVLCGSKMTGRLFRVYWAFIRPFSGLVRRAALKAIKRDAEARDCS
ncbi:MAG TPA: hypothetical protein VE262_05290 [Blastocatellia bacterium]|nr:hypothetical protein [Blastocatellia bacterium]